MTADERDRWLLFCRVLRAAQAAGLTVGDALNATRTWRRIEREAYGAWIHPRTAGESIDDRVGRQRQYQARRNQARRHQEGSS